MTAAAAPCAAGAASSAAAWRRKPVSDWDNAEVRTFLDFALPGHPCASTFRHTSGKVLNSLTKEDLRRHVRDEEAANVIWAQLLRLRDEKEEREVIEANGAEPFTVFIRTPAEISVELEVRPMDTVADVKARMASVEGTPAEMQRLTRHGGTLLDGRTLASYSISHGAMLLLVPRLSIGSQRYAAPAAGGFSSARGLATGGGGPAPAAAAPRASAASGMPRPRVPVACSDIARPFPMHLEFEGIPEYQSFMLALQRQAGRRDSSCTAPAEGADGAPFLELLPLDNLHEPVQTRISFDTDAEILLIDTVGDVLMECTKYRVLLHLRAEQKHALLVTGIRAER